MCKTTECCVCVTQLSVVCVTELDDDWEEELQHELQEYEVVMQGQDGVSDLDLESELLRQMEEEQDELQAAVDGAKPAAH